MSDEQPSENEYLDLPDDSELAFAILQQRKYAELEAIWNANEGGAWYHERRYVDTLVASDEVHNLGILTAFRSPPNNDNEFGEFFHDFRRNAEIASQKIMMETARRHKTCETSIIVLDATARQTIHKLINAIREKLNQLTLPESKRDILFNKLNAFANEVDRNRTRTDAFYEFAVDTARTLREVHEEIEPIQKTIDRIFDWIEKAQKWKDLLPPWSERRRIEGPSKRLPSPQKELDDDIPF